MVSPGNATVSSPEERLDGRELQDVRQHVFREEQSLFLTATKQSLAEKSTRNVPGV